ncbi:MAG: tetratricopeptide repeat protein [Phycisphaerales bacterium]|nr:tetratricopeptide repeat protein [Phycisphaerales bacterium]
MDRRSYLRQTNPKAAITVLKPYLDPAYEQFREYSQVLLLQARCLIASNQSAQAAQLLRPQLQQKDPWLGYWINLAGYTIPQRENAITWLQEAAPSVTESDINLRLALADAWQQLYARHQQPGDLVFARTLYLALLEQPKLTAEQLVPIAFFFHQQDEKALAIKAYERVLEVEEFPVAMNNLAMLHIEQGQPAKALPLAQKAVQATGEQDSSFLDTLGQVHLNLKQYDQALAAFHKALAIAPRDPDAMLHLAKTLVAMGQKPQAKQILSRFSTEHPDIRNLSQPQQQVLAEVTSHVNLP